jgi:hypothetical protein
MTIKTKTEIALELREILQAAGVNFFSAQDLRKNFNVSQYANAIFSLGALLPQTPDSVNKLLLQTEKIFFALTIDAVDPSTMTTGISKQALKTLKEEKVPASLINENKLSAVLVYLGNFLHPEHDVMVRLSTVLDPDQLFEFCNKAQRVQFLERLFIRKPSSTMEPPTRLVRTEHYCQYSVEDITDLIVSQYSLPWATHVGYMKSDESEINLRERMFVLARCVNLDGEQLMVRHPVPKFKPFLNTSPQHLSKLGCTENSKIHGEYLREANEIIEHNKVAYTESLRTIRFFRKDEYEFVTMDEFFLNIAKPLYDNKTFEECYEAQ